MSDRGKRIGSAKRGAIGLVAIVLVVLVGALALGLLGVPSVADMQNSFGEVSEDETVIETDLVISNPNPIGFAADGVDVNYTVNMNDIPMANGSAGDIDIERGNSSLPLESTMRNDAIGDWWTSHVGAGEESDVDVDVIVTTDRFDRSVEHTHSTAIETDLLTNFASDEPREIDGDLPLLSDPVLIIEETDAEWGTVTGEETPIEMAFHAHNPNTEPVVLTQLSYEITMNDVPVGEGETDREYVIPGNSRETIDLTTAIDATRLDDWWVTHLDEEVHGHQVSELRIEFSAIIEGPSGERIHVELDPLTYEEWIGTDIFDEGGEVGQTPDTSDDDTQTDDDGQTADEEPPADDGETDDADDGETDDADDGETDDADDGETDDADDGETDDADDGETDDADDGLLGLDTVAPARLT